MEAKVGDTLVMHGRSVGQHDRTAQIVEVLGTHGEPPYRVRFDDGREALMSPARTASYSTNGAAPNRPRRRPRPAGAARA